MTESIKRATTGPESRRLLRRREVASRFGVSPQTVTRWAKAGLLPYVHTMGGQRRYPDHEVERIVGQLWLHSLPGNLPVPARKRPTAKEQG